MNRDRELAEKTLAVLERIERMLRHEFNRVLGGVMSQIGDPMPLVPIQPGQTPVFQVAPRQRWR